jgi:hypothetical protein
MKLACETAKNTEPDWRGALSNCFELGLPSLLNMEWLIDRTERDEWSGLWW